jgi:hypothetical protein
MNQALEDAGVLDKAGATSTPSEQTSVASSGASSVVKTCLASFFSNRLSLPAMNFNCSRFVARVTPL